MSSAFLRYVVFAGLASCCPALNAARVLRVCADPNNLPFSNETGQGLENKLLTIIARDLDAKIEYTWWSERKSFIKNSLAAGKCDVVPGIASAVNSVLATEPYYRSTYVFLSRSDRELKISSLGDERLKKLKIGVHIVGDDYAPPAHALAQRGLSANLVGFCLFDKFGVSSPPAKLIDAITHGEVDIGIVWGPFAGYFAKQSNTALEIKPVTPAMWMGVPFTYDISMGVRPNDSALRDELNAAMARHCFEIRELLAEYGVPTLPESGSTCVGSQLRPSASLR